jgi:hypothetical protein
LRSLDMGTFPFCSKPPDQPGPTIPRRHGESFLSSEAVAPGRFNFAYKQALSPLKPIYDRTDRERSGLGQRALEEWNIREPSRAGALRWRRGMPLASMAT